MKLENLQYTEGSRFVSKRIGRGQGSGNGKTAGKGHKGQKARSGGGSKAKEPKKPSHKDPVKNKKDRYHDVNISLKIELI